MGDKTEPTKHGATRHTSDDVKQAKTAEGTRGAENPNPAGPFANSGLDQQGNMRIGERYSIGVRGEDLVLTQAHSGREVIVSEAALAGLIEDEYFTDKVD